MDFATETRVDQRLFQEARIRANTLLNCRHDSGRVSDQEHNQNLVTDYLRALTRAIKPTLPLVAQRWDRDCGQSHIMAISVADGCLLTTGGQLFHKNGHETQISSLVPMAAPAEALRIAIDFTAELLVVYEFTYQFYGIVDLGPVVYKLAQLIRYMQET